MNKRALQSALLPCLATTCIVACSSVDPEEDAFTDGPWTEIPARSDAIRISGHTDWDSDSHAVTGWSGTAYTVGFNGSGLKGDQHCGSCLLGCQDVGVLYLGKAAVVPDRIYLAGAGRSGKTGESRCSCIG